MEGNVRPMKKEKKIHPILSKVEQISKNYILDLDPETVPTEPQEFLDWWWESLAKNCISCPLSQSRNSVVKPDGIASAKIMIVGEGPGFLEDLSALPMIGPLELKSSHCSHCLKANDCYSSRILKSPIAFGSAPKAITCKPQYTNQYQLPVSFYLRSAGAVLDGILIDKWKFTYARHNWIELYNSKHTTQPLDHESPWYITNATLCRTTDVTRLSDKPPEGLPKKICRRWLAFQWAAVQPEIIISFGRVSLGVLMDSEKAAERVTPNTIVDTKFGPVLFQNHPAFFMRERSKVIKAYNFAKIASTLSKALEIAGYPC